MIVIDRLSVWQQLRDMMETLFLLLFLNLLFFNPFLLFRLF